MNERQLSAEPSFTFYTCSTGCTDDEPRWRNDGIGDAFFLSHDDARLAAAELHHETSNDAQSGPTVIRLEKVRTVPISSHSVLSLLNGDLASFIESCEIIEELDAGQPAAEPQIG